MYAGYRGAFITSGQKDLFNEARRFVTVCNEYIKCTDLESL